MYHPAVPALAASVRTPGSYRSSAMMWGQQREHRLWLECDWSARLALDCNVPYALFIGCHPPRDRGEADEARQSIALTGRLGLVRCLRVNFVTYRAADPRDLNLTADLLLPDNFECILNLALGAHRAVVLCGDPPPSVQPYGTALLDMLASNGAELYCYGVTELGWPRALADLAAIPALRRYRGLPPAG